MQAFLRNALNNGPTPGPFVTSVSDPLTDVTELRVPPTMNGPFALFLYETAGVTYAQLAGRYVTWRFIVPAQSLDVTFGQAFDTFVADGGGMRSDYYACAYDKDVAGFATLKINVNDVNPATRAKLIVTAGGKLVGNVGGKIISTL